MVLYFTFCSRLFEEMRGDIVFGFPWFCPPPLIVGTLFAQLLLQFIPIFLKLNRCFCHGLKICLWFGYNLQVNFCHFFRILNLVIFYAQILSKGIDSGYLVWATPPTVLCWSFWNYTSVFVMVWSRAWMGRDFVPGYLSPYYPRVPVTIVFWTCAQSENSLRVSHMSMDGLSLAALLSFPKAWS